MVGTGKLCRVLWCKFHDIWFLVHLTINIFIFDFGRLQAKSLSLSSKTTGKRNHLKHFCYCHYVIKYLMRDMMHYHCLRVLRSHVRRIGKHSIRFFCVPNQSAWLFRCLSRAVFRSRAISWRSFLLTIKSCQTGYLRGLRIPCYRWRCQQ